MTSKFLLILLIFCSFLAASTIIPDPEGYWKFDETSGNIAYDSSGSSTNYNGVLTNFTSTDSAKWIAGKYGNALQFSDQNDVVLLTSNVLDLTSNWTISAWFLAPLPNDGTYWHTLTRGSGGDHQVIGNLNTNELGMYDNVNGSAFHGAGYDMDSLNSSSGWHHIAAVSSGGTTTFYIDGTYVGVSNYQSYTDVYAIGNYQGLSQLFSNGLDEMAVWGDTALDADQISLLAGNDLLTAMNIPEPMSIFLTGFAVLILGTGLTQRKQKL